MNLLRRSAVAAATATLLGGAGLLASAATAGAATASPAAFPAPAGAGIVTQVVLDNGGYTLCLDDISQNVKAGAKVGIWGCNASDPAQEWVTYPDGTLRPYSDTGDAVSVNSSKDVVLEAVNAADTSQQLYYRADGTIVDGLTTAGTNNQVLNDPDYTTTPGAQVILFNQPAVTANAHWWLTNARYGSSALSNRPDSGGNGNWANDSTTRAAMVVYEGDATTGTHTYQGSVSDTGSFGALAGADTPNQGGTDAGLKLGDSLSGTLAGSTGFAFTTNTFVSTAPASSYSGSNPTGTGSWYELFFASSTTFAGAGIDNSGPAQWAWSYTSAKDNCGTVEHWTDASYNSGGQDSTAGNITAPAAGSCPA